MIEGLTRFPRNSASNPSKASTLRTCRSCTQRRSDPSHHAAVELVLLKRVTGASVDIRSRCVFECLARVVDQASGISATVESRDRQIQPKLTCKAQSGPASVHIAECLRTSLPITNGLLSQLRSKLSQVTSCPHPLRSWAGLSRPQNPRFLHHPGLRSALPIPHQPALRISP